MKNKLLIFLFIFLISFLFGNLYSNINELKTKNLDLSISYDIYKLNDNNSLLLEYNNGQEFVTMTNEDLKYILSLKKNHKIQEDIDKLFNRLKDGNSIYNTKIKEMK